MTAVFFAFMSNKNSPARLQAAESGVGDSRRSQTAATVLQLLSLAAFFFFCACAEASPRDTLFGFQLDRALEMRGLSIPLEDSSGHRVGRLQVERVSLESARVGFFRIGILPQWMLRGVRILPESEGDCRWIGAFHALLQRESALVDAQIEDFQVLTASGHPVLSARSGGFSKDLGKISLEKVLIDPPGRERIFLRQGEIRLIGRGVGKLLGVVPSGRDFDLCIPSSPP
jgi:hypothetical protein